MTSIIHDYLDERDRQEMKFPEQHLPNGTSHSNWSPDEMAAKAVVANRVKYGGLTWRDVLYEEVCESFAEENDEKLRIELIQVMAVAGRWIEDIDRRYR